MISQLEVSPPYTLYSQSHTKLSTNRPTHSVSKFPGQPEVK